MHIFLNVIILGEGPLSAPQTQPHHFLKLNFISEICNFAVQSNAYQKGIKINTKVNEPSFEEYWYALEYIDTVDFNEYAYQFPSA